MEEVIKECLKTLGDMKRWDEKIFEVMCRTAQVSAKAVLEAIDSELAKLREKGLRMVGKRKRAIVTKFGSFNLNRRLYKDHTGKNRFLLDEALGLKPRSQVTPYLEATVLKLSSLMPFRQAAETLEDLTGGALSHQMV